MTPFAVVALTINLAAVAFNLYSIRDDATASARRYRAFLVAVNSFLVGLLFSLAP